MKAHTPHPQRRPHLRGTRAVIEGWYEPEPNDISPDEIERRFAAALKRIKHDSMVARRQA